MKKILIVGGGTAGLVSALIIKARFSKLQVDLVKSENIPIVGVGEGTTEHWKEFMECCNIPLKELLQETDATFKYGIMFEGWTKKPYFHNVTASLSQIRFGQYLIGYAYAIINNLDPKKYTNGHCFTQKVIPHDLPNQFHFNTFKLNTFLRKKCLEAEIRILEDEIINVNTNKNHINYIESKNKKYKYDFYIDSTGYSKGTLITKLGSKWQSHGDYLPMNQAIAFPTPDTEEYNPYTLAKAMSAGWMWKIPTRGRCGNGYVFNNKYINAEQAQKECEHFLGFKIKVAKDIKFDAGYIDKPWVGNCVAIGLCASFLEPLEASAIGTSIQQAFLLSHLLINHKQTDRDLYNQRVTEIVQNIRDFVVLHYMVKKKDSKFWKELKVKIPPTLQHNLNKWKQRLPIAEDFPGGYKLFGPHNFTILLKELGLVNKKLIKKEYGMLSEAYKNCAKENVTKHIQHTYYNKNVMGHKESINAIIEKT